LIEDAVTTAYRLAVEEHGDAPRRRPRDEDLE
jgi:hypothetical protein